MEAFMNTDYSYLRTEYPATISMDQLYKICHVSKRKARWLLVHGVIPCEDNGNQTRRFAIKLTDVIIFLKNLEQGKVKNMPPPGSFPSKPPVKHINRKKVTPSAFTALLKKQWADQPDMLLPEQAGKLLSYTRPTVHKWIRDDKLKAIPYNSTYLIPKEWLIKYLATTVNDSRASKSAKHMKLILQCQKQK